MKNVRRLLYAVCAWMCCKATTVNAASKDMTDAGVYGEMGNSADFIFYQQPDGAASIGSGIPNSGLYGFYRGLVACVPFIFIFSITIGGFLYAICRKNKGIQRFALFVLILGIPVFCIVFIFGFGFLCGMFS